MKFHELWRDYALYLPAPNRDFVRFAASATTGSLKARLPSGISAKQLNFLQTKSPLFCWPSVLFTATFAVGKSHPTIISTRDRSSTFVLGDSGGFSLISGAIKHSMASWRQAALEWQEKECDVGIIVDVPTRALDVRASGYTSFQQCLDQTVGNMKFALGARSASGLKLLSVYQGRSTAEAEAWSKAVAPYQPQFEGMAIAGHRRLEMADWVQRFRWMMDKGLFDNVSHIHFLGTGQPRFAVLATALQRALRKHVRDDMMVTFDSSTSFTFVQKYGQIITGLHADRDDFRMASHTMPNRGGEFEPGVPFPYRSPLADKCMLEDFLPGSDTTKNAADLVGNHMLAHHSVFSELSAIMQANRLADMAQEGKNATVPYHITKAIRLIDQAIGGSGQAMTDLRKFLAKAAPEPQADEERE